MAFSMPVKSSFFYHQDIHSYHGSSRNRDRKFSQIFSVFFMIRTKRVQIRCVRIANNHKKTLKQPWVVRLIYDGREIFDTNSFLNIAYNKKKNVTYTAFQDAACNSSTKNRYFFDNEGITLDDCHLAISKYTAAILLQTYTALLKS